MAYHHKNLESPGEEIRLLTIAPGFPTQDIKCSVSHHPLATASGYEALSYMWGSQDGAVEILLEDDRHQGVFRVTQNLYQALRCLRYEHRGRVVWIDAISINQDDNAEKSSQVPQIRKIFQNANRVVVWLGEAKEDSDRAMEWIIRVLQNVDPVLFNSSTIDFQYQSKFTKSMQNPALDNVWTALRDLLSRGFWKRVWIIQEIAFARELLLCCGSKSIPWDWLIEVLRQLAFNRVYGNSSRKLPDALEEILDYSTPLVVNALRRTRETPKSPAWFLTLLQTFWSSESEKPQDQIYALLGFLEGSTRPYDGVVHVDYGRTLEKVFTDVVDYCISTPRSVDEVSSQEEKPEGDLNAYGGVAILSFVQFKLTKRAHGPLNVLCASFSLFHDPGWPSWLPDWRNSLGYYSIDHLTSSRFRATADRPGDHRFSPDRRVITVTGHKIDTIVETSDYMAQCLSTFSKRITRIRSSRLMANQVRQWMEFARTRGATGADAGVFDTEKFWRTLVFDSGPSYWLDDVPTSWCEMSLDSLERSLDNDAMSDEASLLRWLQSTTHFRRFTLSSTNRYLMVPLHAFAGDVVCILLGCDVPVVLREFGGHWKWVGDCYCMDWMYGEALPPDGVGLQSFEIH